MKRENAIKSNLKNFNEIIDRVLDAYKCKRDAVFEEYHSR